MDESTADVRPSPPQTPPPTSVPPLPPTPTNDPTLSNSSAAAVLSPQSTTSLWLHVAARGANIDLECVSDEASRDALSSSTKAEGTQRRVKNNTTATHKNNKTNNNNKARKNVRQPRRGSRPQHKQHKHRNGRFGGGGGGGGGDSVSGGREQRWMPRSMAHKRLHQHPPPRQYPLDAAAVASVVGATLDGASTDTDVKGSSGPLFRVPIHRSIVRCTPIVVSADGTDEASQATPVFWSQVPLMGDRLCDFYVVMKPSDAAHLASVRFGPVGQQQGRVWFEWSAAAIEPVAECVYHVDSPFLRSVPMGVTTGMAVNIIFAPGAPMPADNSVHLVVRQQFDINPTTGVQDCIFSLEEGVFQIGRKSGYVWMHAPDTTALATWRAAHEHHEVKDGPRVRLLPPDTFLLPPCEFDSAAVYGVPLSPPELERRYATLLDALLSRKPMPTSMLADLGLIDPVETTAADIVAAEEAIREAEKEAEMEAEIDAAMAEFDDHVSAAQN